MRRGGAMHGKQAMHACCELQTAEMHAHLAQQPLMQSSSQAGTRALCMLPACYLGWGHNDVDRDVMLKHLPILYLPWLEQLAVMDGGYHRRGVVYCTHPPANSVAKHAG
jgi:hypothetical protein